MPAVKAENCATSALELAWYCGRRRATREPCAFELPSLLAFQKSHPEVDVLAVDVADNPEAVTQFLTSKRLTGLHVALTKSFPEGMAQNYHAAERATLARLQAKYGNPTSASRC